MYSTTIDLLMVEGKYPLNELNDKFMKKRFSRPHKFTGMNDVNLFELKESFSKRVRFPTQSGIGPDILLFWRDISPNCLR